MTAVVPGFDAIGANVASLPAGAQAAGYTTGSGVVPWTAADWEARPGAVRICQDAGATDTTADVLDVESGAATITDCAPWFRAALASYKAGTRPGQRSPAIYASAASITLIVNALIAAGISAGPMLWPAHWGIGEAAAEAVVNASGGPFPVIGVQYSNGAEYDYDVWLGSWLSTVSGGVPAPVPAPAPASEPPARRNTETPVVVDDVFGPLTIKAQQFVDFNGVLADCDGVFGYHSKVAMQLHLGVTPDGVIGPVSTRALQARVGAAQDGLWGPATTGCLQRSLNSGSY